MVRKEKPEKRVQECKKVNLDGEKLEFAGS